jgi:hypothetical protein
VVQVKVTHQSITDPDAKKPPKRDPVPEGTYGAIIMKAVVGLTKSEPKLTKVAVEFQILYTVHDDGTTDEALKGRRVFQDFVCEPDESFPDLSSRRRYELVMLLDATGVTYTEDGFDNEHLVSKSALITVRHRDGTKIDEETGKTPVFTNVTKIDSIDAADDSADNSELL